MQDLLVALQNTPIPTILVIGGILFLFLAVGGQFGARINSGNVKRGVAAVLGLVLLAGGLVLNVLPANEDHAPATPDPTATVQPRHTEPTNAASTGERPATAIPVATATQLGIPRITDFRACPGPCDEARSLRTFPEKTRAIYFAWRYDNIPIGAHYRSRWYEEDTNTLWAVNDCTWPGPASGDDDVAIYDGKGLASGSWLIQIIVNEQVLLQEKVFIEGDWKNTEIGGVFPNCHFNDP